MNEPLVSVIIPSFDRFDYLMNAIESINNQTYKNIEKIIVNDGSSDDRYYNFKFDNKTKVVNLEINQKNFTVMVQEVSEILVPIFLMVIF